MASAHCGRFVEVWGPCMWKVMHATAATAPRESTDNLASYVLLYKAIGYTLPCPHCREHYLKYIQANPLETFLSVEANHKKPPGFEDNSYGNMALQRWVHALHNDVNRRLNKRVMSFEESLRLVHDSCSTWVTPAALADPFYSRGSNWLTHQQNERIHGRTERNQGTASFKGSNLAIFAVMLLTVAAVVVTIKRPSKIHESTSTWYRNEKNPTGSTRARG